MITRIWRGWTNQEKATAYERLLQEEIFTGIANRNIPGYHGISLLKRVVGDEVEFVTVMWFSDLNSVRQFAGEDCERAVVPPKARALLLHFDERSAHYETLKDPPEMPKKND